MNIYKEILIRNLPRLINLYNLDPCSKTYGLGDRLFWGWKISDFSNGTFQGGVHSLAIAVKMGIVENESFVLDVIDAGICGIEKIRRKSQGLEEAYPGENSFCVTALVAFDVLSAIRYLDSTIDKEKIKKYLEIIRPLIQFIVENDEKHAFISNHLATAVAAITLWNSLSGERLSRGDELLELIYKNQSKEGWYKEYEAADPGYQTLCTYYLWSVYEITNNEKLLSSLLKSIAFLKFFIHPDGSLGGLYGSRNTEVYYPAGLVGLMSKSEELGSLIKTLELGYADTIHILPEHIDPGNYIPLLNSYAAAALAYENNNEQIKTPSPTDFSNCFEMMFKDAGLYIKSTQKYYAIVNYKKGGTIKVFDKDTKQLDIEDGGIFGTLTDGTSFSTQHFDQSQDFENQSISARFYKNNEAYPSSVTSILIRFLSLTVFRSAFLNTLFKKIIVRKLMTGKKAVNGKADRKFDFKEDKIRVYETIDKPENTLSVGHKGKFKAIHMASSGYYHKQDEYQASRLVNFI